MIIINDKNYYSSTSSIPLKHKRGDIRKLKKFFIKIVCWKIQEKENHCLELLDIAAFQK